MLTRHHILSLRVDQVLALHLLLAGARIAREGDAGAGRVAEIAVDHGLDVAGRAEEGGDAVDLAVLDGALRVPRAKDGLDAGADLVVGVLRKLLAVLLVDGVVHAAEFLEVVGGEVEIVRDVFLLLEGGEFRFEGLVGNAQDDVAKHVEEATVRVVGEALVAGGLGEALDGFLVEALLDESIINHSERI